jgi:hypothetical protein
MAHPVLDSNVPAASTIGSVAESIHVAPDGDETNHLDYDLHPLCVHSLEHYVERDGDERFHVR